MFKNLRGGQYSCQPRHRAIIVLIMPKKAGVPKEAREGDINFLGGDINLRG